MPASQPPKNLTGKLAVVTGASSGIGKEIARGLAVRGAEVVLACRNRAKAEAARMDILASAPGSSVSIGIVDLGRRASVRDFASDFLAHHPRLDILVNNAGGWTMDRIVGADGVEQTWMTNVVGPHLLTHLLLPALKSAGRARIVNLSSTVAKGLDLGDVEWAARKWAPMTVYAATKQANRMWTWALADQLRGSGVAVNALSPGLVKTDLNRDVRGPLKFFFGLMLPIMGKTPAQGADTAIWLASDPAVEGVTGKFFVDRKETDCKYRSDKAAIAKLMSTLDRMARLEAAPA
jgi:NAD(P)-dependent dehydrogenase (short-subunit alcohol dehydrogenase family)